MTTRMINVLVFLSIYITLGAVACPPPPPPCTRPSVFSLSSPQNAASCQPIVGLTLTWQPIDTPYFEIHLGTSPTQFTTSAYCTGTYWAVPSNLLQPNTTYYWKVTAYSFGGYCTPTSRDSTEIFSFTTEPGKASIPVPTDASNQAALSANLTWTSGAGATSYHVYFGTDSTTVGNANISSSEYKGEVSSNEFTYSRLNHSTTYYWRIDEEDNNGCVKKGDVWHFTTAKIWYVNNSITNGNGTSWTSAFDKLQNAFAAAGAYDEIWVAGGTGPYYPDEVNSQNSDDRSSTFQLEENVKVYGGFVGNEPYDYDLSARDFVSHETVLSGDIDQSADFANNSYHTVISADNTIIDGFTITKGNSDGIDSTIQCGAGVYNSSDSFSIRNCKIYDNKAALDGGGIYNLDCLIDASSGTVKIENCEVKDNYARGSGGGMYNHHAKVKVSNSLFEKNIAGQSGGSVINSFSDVEILNCEFVGNVDQGLSSPVTPEVGIIDINSTWLASESFTRYVCNESGFEAQISYGDVNEDQIRWGVTTSCANGVWSNDKPDDNVGCAKKDLKSGLGFTAIATPIIKNIDDIFEIGQLRHFNRGIYWAAKRVDLIIDINIAGLQGVQYFKFKMGIDETTDTHNGCVITGRDDHISFPVSWPYAVIEIENRAYTFQLKGFGESSGNLLSQMTTPENTDNAARLWATIISTPSKGAVKNISSEVSLTNCIFVGNTSEGMGAALSNWSCDNVSINNCTITSNSAEEYGGIYNHESIVDINNTIIWNNIDDSTSTSVEENQIHNVTSDPTVRYCAATYSCIQDTNPSDNIIYRGRTSNIDDNPLFVTASSDGGDGWNGVNDNYGDLRLQSGSPCIDAANNTEVPEGITTDLDGIDRFYDAATYDSGHRATGDTRPYVDMGAYEYHDITHQPEAQAGQNQPIQVCSAGQIEEVALDASDSTDAGNDIVSYEWSWVDSEGSHTETGETINIQLTQRAEPYTITLTVTDSLDGSDTDTVDVSINLITPSANAGEDITVVDGGVLDKDESKNAQATVELDGSGSSGLDLYYIWYFNNTIIAEGVNQDTPEFDLGIGIHTIVLLVTDKCGNISYDEVVVTVKWPSSEDAEIDAGDPQEKYLPSDPVTLNGVKSDPGNNIATYLWEVISAPDGGYVNWGSNGQNSLITGFTVPSNIEGTYEFMLYGKDSTGMTTIAKDSTSVTFGLTSGSNNAPKVEAWVNSKLEDTVYKTTTNINPTATLTGDIKDDGMPNGKINYQWVQIAGPIGGVSFAPLSNSCNSCKSMNISTTATFSKPGNYQIALRASDGMLNNQDIVMVTMESDNAPPEVCAGLDKYVVIEGSSVDVKMSDAYVRDVDAPFGNATKLWEVISDNAGYVTFIETDGEELEKPTIRFSNEGRYEFRLTSIDGSNSATDNVVIVISDESIPVNPAETKTIYLGTSKYTDATYGVGAKVYRKVLPSGDSWEAISTPEQLGNPDAVLSLCEFGNGNIYAGTLNPDGANVYMYGGSGWVQVSNWTSSGIDNADITDIYTIAKFNDALYVGTNYPNKVFKYKDGAWTEIEGIAGHPAGVRTLRVWNGRLYLDANKRTDTLDYINSSDEYNEVISED